MLERHERGGDRRGLRVSDAEREQVVAVLRRHCADGRLTLDEFSDRVGQVYAARTRGELDNVTIDLPGVVPPPQARPSRTSSVIGVMSGGVRRGRWRPGDHVTAFAFWGGCHLDFRTAEIEGTEVTITAVAIMGGIEIVVPEGVRVEVDAVPIMGGVDRRIRDVPVLPGTPVIRVRAYAFWGGVTVRSKPSRSIEKRDRELQQAAAPAPATAPAPAPAAAPAATQPGEAEPAPAAPRPPARAEAGEHPRTDTTADGTVTILFSDIEDFTGLTERLGDLRAQEVLRAHNEIVRARIAACGGREVKSQGDSFMVSFSGARRGVRCAIAIQRALAEWSASHPDAPLRVRIGLHTGEAITEADDLFGRSVIVTARIAAQAGGGEILVSHLLRELADSSGEFVFGPPRRVVLKGLTGEHEVFPVDWEGDELNRLLGTG